jgi:arylsulfatase A-like enzyme
MSHYAIHAPWEKDERYYQKYIDSGLNDFNASYASMIEGMDKSLGDIMDNIEAHGISDNTLIVFMSDNGQPKQAQLNKPLRGHKLTPYEGGSRVPFIASWPGKIKHGSETNEYIIIEDVFPTFLDMANINYHEKLIQEIDGVSFLPLLEGKSSGNNKRPIFWHFPHTYDHLPYSAVRKGDWKLIYHHLDQRFELFNLEKDIAESKDLAKREKVKVKELSDVLSIFLKDSNAGMPVYKNGSQVPYPNEVL